MDSKRRMVELHIWDDPGYCELSPTGKLQYWFVITRCDNVGVYRHSPKLETFHCGQQIELESFIDTINFDRKRIEQLDNGSLWIKDFVQDTWGTIAAGNNLGVSCYKLLAKHGLLSRFISEYPNCIKVDTFREAITENKLDLPLPQPSPSLAPENNASREYEGQGSPRAGTINNIINTNKSISNEHATNIDKAINPKPALYSNNILKELKKTIPKRSRSDESDISLQAAINSTVDAIENNVDDPADIIIQQAKKIDWNMVTVNDFFEGLKTEYAEAVF